MSNFLVPQVRLKETVDLLAVQSTSNLVVGIVGTSEIVQNDTNGNPMVISIASVSQADAYFGSNYSCGADLVPMIRKAFEEGASKIKAVSCGVPTRDTVTAGVAGNLTFDVPAGSTFFKVADNSKYSVGDLVFVGLDTVSYDKEERRKVVAINVDGKTVTVDSPFVFEHYVGEKAVKVTPKVLTDYESAIASMLADEDKTVVVIEQNTDDIAAAMNAMCYSSAEQYSTPCVYLRGCEDNEDETTIVTKAGLLNSSRTIMVYPQIVDFSGKVLTSGLQAAALAGILSLNGVPKLNHNFSNFRSVGGLTKKVVDFDALIAGGVSPIDLKNSSIHLVRLITTATRKNGIPDRTWIEGAVRLNVDAIQKIVQRALHAKFMTTGNNEVTRNSIKIEIVAILDRFTTLNILVADPRTNTPAYKDPVVAINPFDDTAVDVDIEMSPGKPLNFINLNFKIWL